jgi:N-acetylglucosaminyl-diphospho-decaprenol L-rhamnosyltransferase
MSLCRHMREPSELDNSATRDVAVIIVSYKTAALTIDCLESLVPERSSTTIRLRVVVVDNASGDAPAVSQAVETRGWGSWVTVITAPRNGGFAYGNNLGFAHACKQGSPHYFHLLNPDTRVLAGAVGRLVDFLESHPQAGIAGSSFEDADGTDWPIAFRFPTLMSEIEGGLQLGIVSRLLRRWSIARTMSRDVQQIDWGAGASMMIKFQVLEAIGGLDENFFLYYEETEFCWRAKRAGFLMWYVPQSRVIHISGQSTKFKERGAEPKRLPGYWFESRRRYFLLTRGLFRTVGIDVFTIAASALGSLRLIIQGRRDALVPHYLADFWSHSAIRGKNRQIPARHIVWRDN